MRNYGRVVNGNKYCFKCESWKPLDNFYFDSARNAHNSPCKSCRIPLASKAAVGWKKANPKKVKLSEAAGKRKSNYGLTQEDFLSMLEAQDNSCAICFKPLSITSSDKASKPHVDHCHVSGVVRGLLCLTCNTGIGMLNDSVDLLEAAKQYLLSHGADMENGDPVTASVSADSQQVITIH